MYDRKPINGSIKWLDVTSFLHNDEPAWTYNIFIPSLSGGVGGTYKIWALDIQPVSRYVSVDVPWRGAVPARTVYLL